MKLDKMLVKPLSQLHLTQLKFDSLEVIKKFGYKGESHSVETSDGYALTIHRIVPNSIQKVRKPPCFLIHGVIESSLEYLQLQQDSLPFVLSDNGFDVYLGNARGNQYTAHRKYDKNSSEFWDFGWHEIGILDLPPMIDYVLNFTGHEKLFFIGFSQGATVGMVLLSMLPEYNQKIEQIHLAGPAVFMSHFVNPIMKFHGRQIVELFTNHNMVNLTAVATTFQPFMQEYCHKSKPFKLLPCLILEFMTVGGNIYKLEADLEALRNFLNVFTPYTSKKQLLHFLQLMHSERFHQFDYGTENMQKYGTEKPPDYDLKLVDAPVYIYCAGQDGFTERRDVEKLRDNLPNVKNFRLIKNFNHYDFEGSRRAKKEVYLPMVEFMNSSGTAKTENIILKPRRRTKFWWIGWFSKF
ncbi:lipase 3-like [Chironomus tepperi]|uniref:lipase 3-like n=1 Tax=Chironomus tepperi TaxID=113505 RepID=UPI00391FA234